MPGVTWDERRTGYWLASNGRWYAPEQYPGGWDTTALPPAPEHRTRRSAASMITERTKRLRDSVNDALEEAADRADAAPPPPPGTGGGRERSAPPPPPSWTSSPPSSPVWSSGAASATVTATTAYNSRLAKGAPPPPALESAAPGADELPDPPGRITSDDDPAT